MMTRKTVSFWAVVSVTAQLLACDEAHPVGAPCRPDDTTINDMSSLTVSCTDLTDGSFVCEEVSHHSQGSSDIIATVGYAVDEGCGQCDGDPCIEQTVTFVDAPQRHPDVYRYCSCACMDSEGRNSSSKHGLCECPPSTVCSTIGEDGPAYCIPWCMAWGCMGVEERCVPPAEGAKPWKWRCVSKTD